jgi:ABC-type spermidine/putrescine transport system permease subunit I
MPGSHLADHGIINNFLMTLCVATPVTLLYNEGAVLVGLAYTYLPLWCCRCKLPERLIAPLEAADLGLPADVSKVTLPLTKGMLRSVLALSRLSGF